MKRLIIIAVILGLIGLALADGPTNAPVPIRSSSCSGFTWLGALCIDTDDAKLYKGTGSGVEEIGVGAPGPTGPTGPTGAQGIPGENGANGIDGLACWDLNGNGECDLGTEDINSSATCTVADCKGEQGIQGIQGIQGPTGATGPTGVGSSTDNNNDKTFKFYSALNWTKYSTSALLPLGDGGSWDSLIVGDPSIIWANNQWYMFYSGYNGTHEGVGFATSTDLVTWTKYGGNPVLSWGSVGEWDELHAAKPVLIKKDNTWYMFYDGVNNSDIRKVGFATSTDLVTWTKYGGNPVFSGTGGESWDNGNIECGAITELNGTYYMQYHGRPSGGGVQKNGVATSTDLINWTRYASNPIISPGTPGKWDDGWVSSSSSIVKVGQYYVTTYLGGDTASTTGSDEPGIRGMGWVYSTDLLTWAKTSVDSAIFYAGATGDFDSAGPWRGHPILVGNKLYLFYNASGVSGEQIGLQTAVLPGGFDSDYDGNANIGTTSHGGNLSVVSTLSSEMAPALSAGNWTGTNGWAISGGHIVLSDNASAGTMTPSGTFSVTAGTTYKVVVVVSAIGSNPINVSVGHSLDTYISTTGTKTFYLTASDTAKLILSCYPHSTATITSISVVAMSNGNLTVDGTFTSRGVTNFGSSIGVGLPSGDVPDFQIEAFGYGSSLIGATRTDNSTHAAFLVRDTGSYSITNPLWMFGKYAGDELFHIWSWNGVVDTDVLKAAYTGQIYLPNLGSAGSGTLLAIDTNKQVIPFTGTGILKGDSTLITNSSGLAYALSDETGSGSAVFGTTPTFTTELDVNSSTSAIMYATRANVSSGSAISSYRNAGAYSGTNILWSVGKDINAEDLRIWSWNGSSAVTAMSATATGSVTMPNLLSETGTTTAVCRNTSTGVLYYGTCGGYIWDSVINVRPYTEGLDYILQMNPKTFDEIDSNTGKVSGTNLIGLIGDEMPDERLKIYEKDTGKIGNYDEKAVVATLVNAVKELNIKIEKLEAICK